MDLKPEGGKKAVWEADEDFSVIGNEDKDYIRIDLACGNNKKSGFIGIDISAESQADIIMDLQEYPWPIEEYSHIVSINYGGVNEINCNHFVEHVTDLKSFMEEVWNVLVPGGIVRIAAPYQTHIRAHQDFSHVRCINEVTFHYFSQPQLKALGISHYDVNCDFDVTLTRFIFEPEWNDRSEEAKEWARKHYNNVVLEIEVYLKAVKPMRKNDQK